MTTTDQAPPTNGRRRRAPATVEPFDANAAAYQPTRNRRRPMLIALGVVVTALGVLASVYLVNNAGDTRQVLAMRTAVSRGQTIDAGDLTIAQISLDPAIKTVPAADRGNIIARPPSTTSRQDRCSHPTAPPTSRSRPTAAASSASPSHRANCPRSTCAPATTSASWQRRARKTTRRRPRRRRSSGRPSSTPSPVPPPTDLPSSTCRCPPPTARTWPHWQPPSASP